VNNEWSADHVQNPELSIVSRTVISPV